MRSILLVFTAVFLLFSRLAAQSPAYPPTQSQTQSAAQPCALPGPVPPDSTLSGAPSGDRTLLPNGWYLTPAGQPVPLSSDLPLNMTLAPDGVHLAITNNGNGRQTIDLVNLQKQQLVDSVTIGKAWLGLTFARKHPYLYASGGNDDIIIRYRLTGDRLRTTVWDSTLP